MAKVPDKILQKYEKDTRYNVQFDDFQHQVTDQYSLRNPFGFYFETEKLKYMVKLFNYEKINLSGKSILDIGCHYGYHLNKLAFLKGSCENMVGIDIIEDYIQTARGINPGMVFEKCQSLEEWPEGPFNLITAIYVLSEIPAKDGYREQFIRAITDRQETGDYLMVMNFKRMPRWVYKTMGLANKLVLNKILPSLAQRIDRICALSLERNLDDEGMTEQFPDYELIKSYSCIFFFGRDLYLKCKLPIPILRFLELICPVHKYYSALLKRR